VFFNYCIECGSKLLNHEAGDGFCATCKEQSACYTPYSFGDEHSIFFDIETSEFESRSV
jgi:uncharacterized Zn finger protein (UPF0148 family)